MDRTIAPRFLFAVAVALLFSLGLFAPAASQDGDTGDGEEVTPTLVFPNITARDWLTHARKSLDGDNPDAAQAVRALGEVLEYRPEPSDPARNLLVHTGDRVYRNARAIARDLLRTRIEPTAFRAQFDGLAQRQFDDALATMDPSAIAAVIERYPLATCYPEALRALADAAFDNENYRLACRVLGRVATEFPAEDDAGRALQLARWALCAEIAQEADVVDRTMERLRGEFAAVRFRLGGRDWTGTSFDLGAWDTASLRGASINFTQRVSPVRPLRADSPFEFPATYGEPMWTRAPDRRYRRGGSDDDDADAHRGMAVAVGDRLIMPGPGELVALDLVTGLPRWSRSRLLTDIGTLGLMDLDELRHVGEDDREAEFVEGYDEVLVESTRVAVLVQVPVRAAAPGVGQREVDMRITSLVVYDALGSTAHFRWGQALFRGEGIVSPTGVVNVCRVPTEHNGRLFVPLRADGRIWLACLDALSGKTLWLSMLHDDPVDGALAGGPGFGPVRPMPFPNPQQQPTGPVRDARVLPVVIADDVAYVVSNVGGVAAVDTLTGEVQWVSEYAPEFADVSRGIGGVQTTWNVSPVVIGNRLLFAVGPAGSAPPYRLRVMDTDTGRVINDVVNVTDVLGGVEVASETRVILMRGERQVTCVDGNGRTVWETSVPGVTGRGTIVDNGMILWPCGNKLKALDVADGALLDAPGIQPDLSMPLGDLTLTGGFLVSRHERGTQVFLDIVRASGFIADALRVQPDKPGGYLLQHMRCKLLGDLPGAVTSLHEAAARTRSRDTGRLVLRRWIALLDERARAGIEVPAEELQALDDFASKFGNPITAATLPVQLALRAGDVQRAASVVVQLLLAERREPLELEPGRRVTKARLLATQLAGWRESAGDEFDAVLTERLQAAINTMGRAERERTLDTLPDFPGVLDIRLDLAVQARAHHDQTEGKDAPHAFGMIRHHTVAVLDAPHATAAQRRLAAALLLPACERQCDVRNLLRAREVLAAEAADTPITIGETKTTVGELLETLATVSPHRELTSGASAIPAERPFGAVTEAQHIPVPIRGPSSTRIHNLRLDGERTKLMWTLLPVTEGGEPVEREVALRGVRIPRGRPVPPSALLPTGKPTENGVNLILDTGLHLVGINVDEPAVRWSRPWHVPFYQRPATALADGDPLAGINAQWSPVVLSDNSLAIADFATERDDRVAVLGLSLETGEVNWTDDTRGTASPATRLLVIPSTGMILYRDTTSSFRLLHPANGRLLAVIEPDGATQLVGCGDNGLLVLGVSTSRGEFEKPNQLLAVATPPVFVDPGDEAVPKLTHEWKVDTDGDIEALRVIGRLVISQEGPMLRLRRLADGSMLAQWPDAGFRNARRLPDGRIAITVAITGGTEVAVNIVDPQTGQTQQGSHLHFRQSPHHRVAAVALQAVQAGDGEKRATRLIVGILRTDGDKTIRPGESLRFEAFVLDPAALAADRVPDAAVTTVAPKYAMVWRPGFLLTVDRDGVVVAPDGDVRHHRIPFRPE